MVTFEVNTGGILKYATIDEDETIIKIPKSIDDIVITKINRMAFSGNSAIKCVYIPKTVKELSFYCFRGCTNLETVVFEEGSQLEYIGEACFYGCDKLSNINIDAAKKFVHMDNQAFFNCKSLTSIDLSNSSIENIYTETFYGSGLKEIQLPKTLKHIYQAAFMDSPVNIDFDSIPNLEVIESNAFKNTGITSVDFSKNVSKSIALKESVFQDCDQLKSVYLSKNTVLKYSSNFENCKKLKVLKMDMEKTYIPVSSFEDCINLSCIDMLSSSISCIGISAFKNCEALRYVIFPESIKIIDENAFENCTLSDYVDLTRVKEDCVLENNCFKDTGISIKSIKLDFLNPITIRKNPFFNSSLPLSMFRQKYPFVIMED